MAHGSSATLARTLGLASLTFFGVGQILGAGIYSVIGAAAGVAGSALWLSFLTAGVVALLTGLSYAELATALPSAGAEYVYLRLAFPRQLWTSFAVGIVIVAAGAATAATVAIAFEGYLQLFLDLPSRFVALGLLAVVTAVNIVGVQQSAWTNIAFTLIESSGLVLAIAVGIRTEGFGLALAAAPHPGIVTAASLVFFAYLGFEDIANLAEEARYPTRDIPRAILISLAVTTLLYVLVGLASVALLPPDQLAASRSPLAAAVAQRAQWLAAVIGAIALFATANTALITLIVGSRMLYGMAKAGDLPRPLSFLHSERRTPWLAALIMLALSAAVVPLREVTITAALSSFATLMAFAAVNLCVLILRVRRPDMQRPFRIPLNVGPVPILPVLGMISALVLATQFPPIVYAVGGSTLAFALLLYAGRRLTG